MLKNIKHLINKALANQGFMLYFTNTSWMFAEQMLRMLVALLVGIWVARYLGPSQYGLLSFALAFVALFSSIAKLGLDNIVVMRLVSKPNLRDIYMGTAFWLKFVGALLMLIVIGIAIEFSSSDSNTKLYVFIIASGCIFQAFEVVDFYFQSKVLSKFVSICKITQLSISSLLKLYLITVGEDLFCFVLVSLVDQITLAITLYFAYRYQKIGSFINHFDWDIGKKLINDSWPLILSGLTVMIYIRIDQIMIKEMLGEKEVGLYSAAVRLSEVWYFIPMLITNSIFPSIVNTKKTNQSLYYLRMQHLYSFMFLAAVVIALPMTFLSEWIVVFLYGDAYRDAGKVLMINIWAGIFVFMGVASSKWFLCEGLLKLYTVNTAIGAIVNVTFNIILIPNYGIYGSAIATVIAQSVASYFMNLVFLETRSNFMRLTRSIFFK